MKKEFITHLTEVYEKKLQKNPRYSLRAFAMSLEVDHTTLSRLLRGQRELTTKTAIKIARGLGVSEEVFNRDFTVSSSFNKAMFNRIDLEIIETMKHWYYDAILELTRLSEFIDDPNWIASKIKIDENTARVALDLLFRLELIKTNEMGEVVETLGNTTLLMEDDTTDALKNLQIELLEKSIESLKNDNFHIRDHSSLTMAIDSSKIDQAIELTKKYRQELCSLMQKEGNNPDGVYQLCVSFYPLTKK